MSEQYIDSIMQGATIKVIYTHFTTDYRIQGHSLASRITSR